MVTNKLLTVAMIILGLSFYCFNQDSQYSAVLN